MELITVLLFCLVIISAVVLDFSLIYALLCGVVIFCTYGKLKGFTTKALLHMIYEGVKTPINVIITFMFIGVLTALWRASGTISVIICYSLNLIHPSLMVLMAFLLNCLISVLIGTSFGTAATMGVIAMTLGTAMGIDPAILGGAILAGVYFGDRCSPLSTSALLVCELTHTNIFDNIKLMFKTAFIPFVITCVLYGCASFFTEGTAAVADLRTVFSREMLLHWSAIIPALLVLLLSFCKVKVKLTMAVSILAAAILCIVLQHMDIGKVLQICLLGYQAQDPEVAALLNGGGIVSMLRVTAIVAISSSYAGIFSGTGLLNSFQDALEKLGKKVSPFFSILVASILTSIMACNQTLSSMLTYQLCNKLEDGQRLAISLENSVIVISGIIPWSIACAVPLTSVNAPNSSIFYAFFLYLLPIYTFFTKLNKA
jgi:NhaC family Na+:H+ antiporter